MTLIEPEGRSALSDFQFLPKSSVLYTYGDQSPSLCLSKVT